jgi:hypothetical protein
MPTSAVMIQIRGLPSPRTGGKKFTCSIPITMPVTPTSDPTDRSMLRVMMTRTMPVAMIPVIEVWTERFHRLRGVRKTPPPLTTAP